VVAELTFSVVTPPRLPTATRSTSSTGWKPYSRIASALISGDGTGAAVAVVAPAAAPPPPGSTDDGSDDDDEPTSCGCGDCCASASSHSTCSM
jgi:hypothetical protein